MIQQHINQIPRLILLTVLGLLLAGCGASSPHLMSVEPAEIFDISSEQDAQKIANYLTGVTAADQLIMKVPRGYSLPIQLEIDTPLARLNSSAGNLEFSQDLYLCLSSEKNLASPDGMRWAPFNDMDLVKKLFGGDQGSLSLAMSNSAETGSLLTVKLAVTPSKTVND